MFDMINQIDLVQGLNISPIPLEFGQEMTTSKWLLSIQAKVNEMILIRNSVLADSENYTDTECEKLRVSLEELKALFANGTTIPNNSIGLEQLKTDFLDKINDVVIDIVKDVAQTVWFGINDEGYFYSVIPESWKQVYFDTNQEGCLILEY